jgi:L-alanine-DL-glutamate epimerase-like enolase superfamily enzyme
MALLDLYTQEKGIPLWRYLRTKRGFAEASIPKPLPLLRMLGGSIDKEITDAKRLREEGYRYWKVKVGILPNVMLFLRKVNADPKREPAAWDADKNPICFNIDVLYDYVNEHCRCKKK